ncbi:MAG: hypothetical protein A2075_16530 [Geobacteraceae bacterium GWC2_58_44]|nr:MAG: hypothetical protein A2075_16530 [Geobacteraceae bacterium GWC2_58_44]HBG05064.1 undecaprenyl-phosphate alpha-N-acetylglucosaminyl 1-phosphate transferase [Geobacter sp.]
MIPAITPIGLSYIFLTALFASLIMVPFLQRLCIERKMLDLPDERKVHLHAVPRLGGVAICMSFLCTLLLYLVLPRGMCGILAGVLIIFATGLVDDIYGLSPLRKLFGEVCAVLTTMLIGNLYIRTLGDLFGLGEIVLPLWLAIPFTVVAIVGVVNAFNLIDGLDGLAGGISVISLVAFAVLAFQAGNVEVLILCVALLGAMLGFLKYNFFPARIFMGDAGSLVVGFVISFLALSLTQGGAGQVQPVVPLLVVGLPVADAVWVMASRLCAGQSPFAADRTHVHHKFLALGFEHCHTVIVIYSISLFWAAAALFLRDKPAVLLLGGYLVLTLLSYVALGFLRSWRHLLRSPGKEGSAMGMPEPVSCSMVANRTGR